MVRAVAEYESVASVLRSVISFLPKEPRVEESSSVDAFGRVSAADVVSPRDSPEHDLSHMDGVAVRHRDALGASDKAPARLALTGRSGPGESPGPVLREGEARRVATGSFLPLGADTVVPIEQVRVRGGFAMLDFEPRRGQFVFPSGEDFRRGSILVAKGRRIRAQDVGILLSLGIERIRVFSRPRVALLATGSELTDSPREGARVRNSHVPIVQRMLKSMGCQTLYLGIAPDRKPSILSKVKEGLGRADMVMTTGGTSVGRLDLAGDVVASLNPSALFHGIRMDRGRVAGVGVVEGKAIVMLPGPVQGAMNAVVLLGLPLIQRLSGSKEVGFRVPARLANNWAARKRFPNFTKVVYVKLALRRGAYSAEPINAETESMSLLTRSDGFVIVPEKVTKLRVGAQVLAMLLPGFYSS